MQTARKRHAIQKSVVFTIGACLIVLGAYMLYGFYYPQNAEVPKQPLFSKTQVTATKKTQEQLQAYTVPPTHPRQLIIPTLGISANVLAMGVKRDMSLDAPTNAWDVGWYQESALPGSGRGALLIDGHINDALSQPGIFYNLNRLRIGDVVQVERGDRQTLTYHVVRVEQKPTAIVDMSLLLESVDSNKEGLNLITCGGTYDSKRQTYTHRTLVYAVRTT